MAPISPTPAPAKISLPMPTCTIPCWKTLWMPSKAKPRYWPAEPRRSGPTRSPSEPAKVLSVRNFTGGNSPPPPGVPPIAAPPFARNQALRRVALLRILVLHHFAAFHHEFHVLQGSHVLARIAVDPDDVGPRPGLQATDFPRPPQQIRRIHRRCLNRLQRRKPQLHHDGELMRIQTMRVNCGIRAESNFHATGKRVRNILARLRNHVLRFCQQGRRQVG